MRTSVTFVLSTAIFAGSILGCSGLLKKKATADAGAEDESASVSVVDAATVAATGLGAKNEAGVLRYANETPIANEPAVIGDGGAKARNFPGNGPEVATLPKGTAVVKIAQYFSTATLIMFDDPSGDGSKLIGWVAPKSFDVAAPTPAKTVVVPPRLDAGVAPPKVVDAGAAPAKVVDAGGGGGGTSTLPQPGKGVLAVPPVNGKCPDGWTVAENMCRRKCSADPDCPRNTKCVSKQGNKVCSSG